MAGATHVGFSFGRLIQRKSVGQIQSDLEHGELKRTLGALNLVLLGVGCVIGTGIFVLTGLAAAKYSGPAITISFVITGTLCAFVALCYAELASALPVSGSAYSYSYASMGELAAWVMGILLVLEYGLSAATVAVGWSGYCVSLLQDFGIHFPAALTAAPGVEVKDAAGHVMMGVMNLPAVLIIAAVTCLLIVGISESATVNNIIVAIKVTVVIAFILIGSRFVNTANWHPLVPAEIPAPPPGTPTDLPHQIMRALWGVFTGSDEKSKYGVAGVITGAARIFFAYLGFEAVSTAGAEAKNPAKDMPIGIIGALVICTVLYIATSAVLVGIVPYTQLDNPAPIAVAVNRMGMPWFSFLVKVGALAGLTSVMLVLLYGQTRIFYTMAKDGLIPAFMGVVHKRFKTPWINTIVVGLIACSAAGFRSLDDLADLSNVGSLAAFALVCITVMYLRFSSPSLVRPFKVPLYPAVPILGAVMCLFLLKSILNKPQTGPFFLAYVGVGFLLYFVYGLWNSKLSKEAR
jgi:APA family basic amino acid/polyamine antiporter